MLDVIDDVDIVVKNTKVTVLMVFTFFWENKDKTKKKRTDSCKIYQFALNNIEKKVKQGRVIF